MKEINFHTQVYDTDFYTWHQGKLTIQIAAADPAANQKYDARLQPEVERMRADLAAVRAEFLRSEPCRKYEEYRSRWQEAEQLARAAAADAEAAMAAAKAALIAGKDPTEHEARYRARTADAQVYIERVKTLSEMTSAAREGLPAGLKAAIHAKTDALYADGSRREAEAREQIGRAVAALMPLLSLAWGARHAASTMASEFDVFPDAIQLSSEGRIGEGVIEGGKAKLAELDAARVA